MVDISGSSSSVSGGSSSSSSGCGEMAVANFVDHCNHQPSWPVHLYTKTGIQVFSAVLGEY